MKLIIKHSLIALMGIAMIACKKLDGNQKWDRILLNKEDRNITLSKDEHTLSIKTKDDIYWNPNIVLDIGEDRAYPWPQTEGGGSSVYAGEIDGGWFKVAKSDLSSVQITIYKNETAAQRSIKIKLLGGYAYDDIIITQEQ